LYCHNFCKLLLLSIKFKIKHLQPDTRICSPLKSCTGINFLASVQLCTATLRQCLRAGFLYRDKLRSSMLAFAALAPARNQNLYPDGKNCAMPRSLRLWWDYLHSQFGVTASIRLSTTNALYCRAVRLHNLHQPGYPQMLLKLSHITLYHLYPIFLIILKNRL
jgi:hypothetical protein